MGCKGALVSGFLLDLGSDNLRLVSLVSSHSLDLMPRLTILDLLLELLNHTRSLLEALLQNRDLWVILGEEPRTIRVSEDAKDLLPNLMHVNTGSWVCKHLGVRPHCGEKLLKFRGRISSSHSHVDREA